MKNKKFLITTVLPIAISLIIGILIVTVTNNFILKSKANSIVESEKKEFINNINALKSEKAQLEATEAEYDEILTQNKALVEEVETLKGTLDEYVSDIASAQSTLADLDSRIAEKQAYLNSISGLTTESESTVITLKKGEYKCPSTIKEGRYTIEGSGTVYVYTIANNLKEKFDLSVIDTHSYTFDITSGETLKVESTSTLKKIDAEN